MGEWLVERERVLLRVLKGVRGVAEADRLGPKFVIFDDAGGAAVDVGGIQSYLISILVYAFRSWIRRFRNPHRLGQQLLLIIDRSLYAGLPISERIPSIQRRRRDRISIRLKWLLPRLLALALLPPPLLIDTLNTLRLIPRRLLIQVIRRVAHLVLRLVLFEHRLVSLANYLRDVFRSVLIYERLILQLFLRIIHVVFINVNQLLPIVLCWVMTAQAGMSGEYNRFNRLCRLLQHR